MEGEKKENVEKLSYDDLKRNYDNLYKQYNELSSYYDRAVAQLQQRDFDQLSFFLQMLFKVVEHKPAYKPEFGKWACDNIQNLMIGFADSLQKKDTVDKDEQKSEQKPS